MADQTDHFMREVQEEMRRERLAGIWDRYGVFIIAAPALLVLAVGGYKYAEYRSLSARQAAGKFQHLLVTRLRGGGLSVRLPVGVVIAVAACGTA